MKTVSTVLLAVSLLASVGMVQAQGVYLSYPIDRSVLQRNGADQATVTLAGQVAGGSSNAQSYSLYYRTTVLDANGNNVANTTTNWIGLGIQTTGQFYSPITVNKGWYRLELATGSLADPGIAVSIRFGVGDVYFTAGQSNAQGVEDPPRNVPGTSGFPDWLSCVNLDWNCHNEFPPIPAFTKLEGYKRIAPNGHSSWAYAVLGKRLSDNGGGVPIAFFNAAAGGSSVLNWYQSLNTGATNSFYTGVQYCNGRAGVSGSVLGQPYIGLKNALHYYASLFGIKAVLWHQGETDAERPEGTKDTQTYKDQLQAVIQQSRNDFGNQSLVWMIAQATYTNGGNITPTIRDAQAQKGAESDKRVGPDTDYIDGTQTVTDLYRRFDETHFDEGANGGLTYLADEWAPRINELPNNGQEFARISANPVPSISISRSGSNRNLSVQTVPGAVEYLWGGNINQPIQRGATLTSFTASIYGGTVRCFIRGPNNNWRITAEAQLGCPSCREGVEENDAFGIAFKAYPNPFVNQLIIAFKVPDAPSHVRLEIIDAQGQVIKTIADGIHDKGPWNYPVLNLNYPATQLYFCRLKVGNLFTVKKLLHIQ